MLLDVVHVSHYHLFEQRYGTIMYVLWETLTLEQSLILGIDFSNALCLHSLKFGAHSAAFKGSYLAVT